MRQTPRHKTPYTVRLANQAARFDKAAATLKRRLDAVIKSIEALENGPDLSWESAARIDAMLEEQVPF